jgi:uncharacterized protein
VFRLILRYYSYMRIFIFIGIVQSILWFGHWFAYKTVVKFFGVTSPSALQTLRIAFVLLSISFLVGTVISMKYYGPLARGFYTLGAMWMGTLYWLFWAGLLSWIMYGLCRLVNPRIDVSIVGIVLLTAALLTSAYGVWNSYQTKIRSISIKLDNLPANWKGKKVVVVADTHLGHVRNLNFSKKIADLIGKQNPEAVFIPGDFYDGSVVNFAELARPFGDIPSTYGTFFAAGNHEEFRPKNMYFDGLRAGGVKILDNEVADIGGLQVIGVGYSETVDPENQKNILRNLGIDRSRASVLIKHAPSHIEAAASEGITLQVSGHTHLGQVYPLKYITRKVYRGFDYGLKNFEETQVLTTSGAGTWGPPQRVGTNSEIWVITFE